LIAADPTEERNRSASPDARGGNAEDAGMAMLV
jgi:hypothetical protein